MNAPATQEVAKVKKIDLARKVFKEIFTPGYKLEGKSQRAVFIARCAAEHQMSKHCAGTYYQNLSNEANGQPLYKYNKQKERAAELNQQMKTLTQEVQHRWLAVNAEGVEVSSFPTRGEAQAYAKANELTWADRTKAA